jgi:iron complex outermembrane receptor protein
LNVAFGGEYRRETYKIGAGVPLSYIDGGASSYPGFTPLDAGSHDRKNEAGYIDLATKPIDGLRIDVAGRFEHFSDFGDAKVGKLTARYDFSPEFAIRGTINNGFRAPTLAEEYYSSTNVGPTTAYIQLPPNSAAAKALGLDGLKPEHSMDYSLGLVWRPLPHMVTQLDIYQITITDRIVGSGQVAGASMACRQRPGPRSTMRSDLLGRYGCDRSGRSEDPVHTASTSSRTASTRAREAPTWCSTSRTTTTSGR